MVTAEDVFNRQARTIYKSRPLSTGAQRRRRMLLGDIGGDILETGCGPGYNFSYYKAGSLVTAVDVSPEMLRLANARPQRSDITVKFIQGDITDLVFPPASFDAIVSTLTFCAYEKPEAVLSTLAVWLKPGGYAAVYEHGLSNSRVINAFLNSTDRLFHKRLGCHQNRNMRRLFQNSGLRILKERTYYFGIVQSFLLQK